MEINIKPGKYVVAVSGGVDSVVLLDLLRQNKDLELVVAHFDHGIRSNSAADRFLVEQVAKRHKLPFYHDEGNLGLMQVKQRLELNAMNFWTVLKKDQI